MPGSAPAAAANKNIFNAPEFPACITAPRELWRSGSPAPFHLNTGKGMKYFRAAAHA